MQKKQILPDTLTQNIGIYYKDEDWKCEVFTEIMNYYDSINLTSYVSYGSEKTRIELKDGSIIRFICADNKSRGLRFNKVILQPGIDESIIEQVIKPTLGYCASCVELDYRISDGREEKTCYDESFCEGRECGECVFR